MGGGTHGCLMFCSLVRQRASPILASLVAQAYIQPCFILYNELGPFFLSDHEIGIRLPKI